MSIVESTEPRIQDVKVTSDSIIAYLVDGRVLSVPLAWSWRLSEATAKQRARFRPIGDGKACTGQISMKTSVFRECYTGCQRIVRKP